jgi:hypothetical protein
MSKSSRQSGVTGAASKGPGGLNRKWFSALLILALLLGSWRARADGTEEEYLHIYGLIQEADDLNTSGKIVPAKTKYEEVYNALRNFQLEHPGWDATLLRYRLNYVVDQITALSEKETAAKAAAAKSKAAAAQTSTTTVKLLETGAEPRKALRLHPNPGDKQTLVLILKAAQETKAGEQNQKVKYPTITVPMDVTVKEVSANGELTCEVKIGDGSAADESGVAQGITKMIRSGVAGTKGLSGTGTVTSRGLSQGVEFKVPPGAQPLTRQLVDQLKDALSEVIIPLPEEAVGPGAKWEAKMPVKTQGITLDQTVTCEWVSLEGENLTIKSAVVQHAANQKVENPALHGTQVFLTELAGKGTGELTFDLAHLLPAKATTDTHTESSMVMDMGGQKQPVSIKSDATFQFEVR